MLLFGDFTRTDPSRSQYQESDYDFLNRSSWNASIRARELCTAWFDMYPTSEQPDLGARFTDDDPGQHLGAYFELALYELLRRLGFTVTVHPSAPGISARPDFLAESGRNRFYLEATVSQASSAEIPDNAILKQIYEWIDELDNPYFVVSVRPSGRPTKQPPRKAIHAPIKDLMAASDPEQVLREFEDGYSRLANPPSVNIELEGCNLLVQLWPKSRHKWGISDGRTIAAWHGGGMGDVAPNIRTVVDKKAREKRVGQLDAPLVVACSTIDGFFKFGEEGLVSLFGRRNRDYAAPDWNMHLGEPRTENGVWVDRKGAPQNTNLAAVWLFHNIRPVAPTPLGSGNRLFLNPFSEDRLPKELLKLATAHVHDGQMVWTDGVDLLRLLDVPEIPDDDLRKPSSA